MGERSSSVKASGCWRALACALVLTWACGGDAPAPAPVASEEPDAGDPPTQEEPAEFEGCPDDIEPFRLGLDSDGDALHAVLLDASKQPPERYLNDWVVELVDADGVRLDDATVVSARPWMPTHGHDGNIQPLITQREPGLFALDRLNFNMRGPWEVQLRLSSASAGDDDVVFRICVAE